MTLQIVLEDSCVKLLTRLCSVDLVTLEMFCLNGIYHYVFHSCFQYVGNSLNKGFDIRL